jgi:branched-chain amino acid transport system substrate-binding protein
MKKARGILSVLVFLGLLVLLAPGPAEAQCQLGVPAIKLGVQGASSGAHADYGRQIMMGATLAVEEINAAGGILGCKLEMKFMDEELKPATAVKNVRYLVAEWGAHFLYGVDSSGSAMAVGQVLPELKRINFFTHAATHRLTEELVAGKGIKEIVRVSVPVYQDAVLAALVFKDMPNLKRFATIGADYEYGYATWNLFKDAMKKFRPDAEFVAAAWAPFWTMDFSPHVSAVMAQKPDAIISTPWAGEAVMLLRQAVLQGVFDQIQAWWQAMGDGPLHPQLARHPGKQELRRALRQAVGPAPQLLRGDDLFGDPHHQGRGGEGQEPGHAEGARSVERDAGQDSGRRAGVQGGGPPVHL